MMKLIKLGILFLLAAAILAACAGAAQPDSTREYVLTTGMEDGKFVFLGVGDPINGQTNPTLAANPGETITITLIHIHSPLDATRLGIGIIYQELNLCANLSVTDNIYLACEICQKGFVDQKLEKKNAQELVKRLEQKIDPSALVGDLRIGQQQIIEIAKALAQDVRILIMDEPTSALSTAEVRLM